jgi:peptidoglycan hydrolase-like protein with peptidoglycan-binding domain
MIRRVLVWVAFTFWAGLAAAQTTWVQVEAQPTLGEAEARARAYAAQFPDVAGFALGSGWYVVALGPYSEADAQTVLRRLRAQGLIPGDSYLTDGAGYRAQYWPVGAGAANTPQPLPEEAATPEAPEVVAEVPQGPRTPDETEREARASEELLTGPERELLQVALQWAGFYEGGIDGAYGRGTRNAMGAWQAANNHEVTGILTTGQRAELLAAYNAVLEGMNLTLIQDTATGIAIEIPTGVVAFAGYEPPFARFDATRDFPAQVLLISQEGDLNRLFGLYEIMQTLTIVPPEGPRARGDASFELEGISAEIHSYTYAALEDGQIKGFTLVWPANDEERRARVLAAMQASFARLPGVLDPALSRPGEDQAIDLVSGLEVRQPQLSRSGFYVDATGAVVTTVEAVAGCTDITLDKTHPATVVWQDDALGLAVLRPVEALAPIAIARFQTGVPRLQTEVAVAGFPYGGVLARPALTFGRLGDIRGLNGEETVKRLEIVTQDGDAGGPVFDNAGTVLGMMLPRGHGGGQVLPPDVGFILDTDTILPALAAAGVTAQTTDAVGFVPPEAVTREASGMTVLVSCW